MYLHPYFIFGWYAAALRLLENGPKYGIPGRLVDPTRLDSLHRIESVLIIRRGLRKGQVNLGFSLVLIGQGIQRLDQARPAFSARRST